MLNQTSSISGSTPFPAHLLPLTWQAVQPALICPSGGRELPITLPGMNKQVMPVWADSEIARFREQQQLEEESGQLGLNGPAAVASHETISARMCRGADVLNKLFEEGRDEEAYDLWDGGILERGS